MKRKPDFLERFALYPDIEFSEKTSKVMIATLL
jgi:hypothetical protein